MTHSSGPGPAEPVTGADEQQAEPAVIRGTDLRQQLRWVPLTAGLAALVIGLAYIVEGLLPGLYHRRLRGLSYLAPGTLANLTRTTDVIIGLLLLMLSHGLRRRKRRAWAAVMALLAVGLIIHAGVGVVLHHLQPDIPLPRLHWSEFVVSAALLVALYAFRRQFYAVGDRRSRWRALWVLAGLLVADIIIGLTYLSFIAKLKGTPTFEARLQTVVQNLAGFTGPVRFAGSPHFVETQVDHFGFIMGGLGLFTLVAALFILMRPAEPAGRLRAADAERIRHLLDLHGDQDSLGYFALRDDKNIVWSPTGKACIGYRVLSGVMLASGDPIGDPEAWPGAIHTFLDEAARHAWVPAVLGCSELGAETWCREGGGLTALELGDEAVVDVAEFSLQGRSMKNVRQMVTRVGRNGYVAQIRRAGDIPRAEIDWMIQQADSWRGSPTERGFSMALGRVGAPGDEDCVIATATKDGVLCAILHFVPWGSDGLSLDLMRRDRSAQPGLNDFLIVETIKNAQALGVKRVSLNFAAFRAALERGERIGAGPVLRAWRGILLFLSRWFQIESLYKFNAKFCPQWVPRFFVYTGTRYVPRIGLAAMEAEAFLVWPTLEVRRMARRTARWLGLGSVRRLQAERPGPGAA